MNSKDIFEYAKQRPYHILVFITALFMSTNADLRLEGLGALVLNFVLEYHHYNKRVSYLKTQGLSEKEYTDKKFIEEWAEMRQNGLTKYCFYDGGLIIGSVLSIFIGAAFFSSGLLGDVTKDLTDMMELIWKSFVIGFIIATAINRLRWPSREKRFEELTGRYFRH